MITELCGLLQSLACSRGRHLAARKVRTRCCLLARVAPRRAGCSAPCGLLRLAACSTRDPGLLQGQDHSQIHPQVRVVLAATSIDLVLVSSSFFTTSLLSSSPSRSLWSPWSPPAQFLGSRAYLPFVPCAVRGDVDSGHGTEYVERRNSGTQI